MPKKSESFTVPINHAKTELHVLQIYLDMNANVWKDTTETTVSTSLTISEVF